MKLRLLGAFILAPSSLMAELTHVEMQAASIRDEAAKVPAPEIWWLRPRVETWRSFDFIQLDGDTKQQLLAALRESKYSATAGNYLLLDVDFEEAQKRAQGFLVLRTVGQETTKALKIRENAMDSKTLSFVDVTLFSPEKQKFAQKWTGSLEGIKLEIDYRSLLLKAIAGKK